MSGPKVIRIVSRQEMENIKKTHVNRLKKSAKLLESYIDKHNVNYSLYGEIEKRIAYYESLDAQFYTRFRDEIPDQITFIHQEKEKIVEQLIDEKRKERENKEILQQSYLTILDALKKRGLDAPEQLSQWPNDIAACSAVDIKGLEDALQSALVLLNTPAENELLSKEQLRIQQSLLKGKQSQTLYSWAKDNVQLTLSKPTQRLNSLVAELQLLEGNSHAKRALVDRANALLTINASEHSHLIIDSLTLDISQFVALEKNKQVLLTEAALLQAELEILPNHKPLLQQLMQLSIHHDHAVIEALVKQAQLFKSEQLSVLAAKAKRDAVLSGLHGLGYTVDEDIESAWVENGRLVVKKADSSPYAIEIKGPAGLEKCQVRVVAHSQSQGARTQEDDTAQEQQWCDDFSRLSAEFDRTGGEIHLEKAYAVGQLPLKETHFESSYWEGSSGKKVTKQKSNPS